MLSLKRLLRNHERTTASPPRMNGVRHSPNARGSLTCHSEPCNSKSRPWRKWNPVKPEKGGVEWIEKQSNTNRPDSIRMHVFHGDCRNADPDPGVLRMYWQACNTHPARLANSRQIRQNL